MSYPSMAPSMKSSSGESSLSGLWTNVFTGVQAKPVAEVKVYLIIRNRLCQMGYAQPVEPIAHQ